MDTPRQGIPLFTAICVLVGTLVVIQLWLLAASIDALLSGYTAAVLVPAAAASLALFLINGGLLLHARNFDRRVRDRGENAGA